MKSLLALTLAITAFAGQDATYSLKPTMKKDASVVLHSKGEVDGPDGSPAKVSLNITRKITDAKDDGGYSYETTNSDFMFNDMPVDFPAPPMTFVIGPKGELTDAKNSEGAADGSTFRGGALDTIIVPDNAVKVGDKWSYTYKGTGDKWRDTVLDFTLAAAEKVNDIDTLKIDVKAKETSGEDPASLEGSVWLDAHSFTLVKRVVKEKDYPIATFKVNGTITWYIDGAAPKS